MGAPAKGAGTAVRLIGGLRQRASFEELRGGVSVRSGPLGLRYAVGTDDRIGIAFAIRRNAGTAVRRNRCRRRIKNWLAEAAVRVPNGVYLMSVSAPAVDMEYQELARCLKQLFEKLEHKLVKSP